MYGIFKENNLQKELSMKNWIIVVLILVVPVVAYFAMDKNAAQKAAFEAQAAQATEKPVVIKFYSPMCLDCKKLEAVVKEVLPKYENRIIFQNINGQSNDAAAEALVSRYNVTLVPTMVFVKKDGTVYKRTEGCLAKEQLDHILSELTK